MSSFLIQQKERILKLGVRRTLEYYVAAAAERVGIGLSVSFEYGGHPAVSSPPNVTFALITSMADWSDSDMDALQKHYSASQLQFFDVLFGRGEICIAAKWNRTDLACVGWIEKTTAHFFAKGQPKFRIYACYTFPDYRGRGLYPQLLAYATAYLQSRCKETPIFVEASVANHASRKGIVRAGFAEVGRFVRVRERKWGWQTRRISHAGQLEPSKA